jgi:ligand-binding sensor domain-containing protein
VVRLFEDGTTRYTTADGLVSDDVTALVVDAYGDVWVGTSEGVSRYDGQTWHTYTSDDGLVDDSVTAMVARPNGEVWFATAGGFCSVRLGR